MRVMIPRLGLKGVAAGANRAGCIGLPPVGEPRRRGGERWRERQGRPTTDAGEPALYRQWQVRQAEMAVAVTRISSLVVRRR